MKTYDKSMKWKRFIAVTMVVMIIMALGITAYADTDDRITVDESEIVAFGPVDESTIVGIGAEPIDEGTVVAIGAEPADESTVVAIGAEAEENVVAIGAEIEGNTVAIGAENQTSGTSSRQKDSVPKTGEADYALVLLPMLLFGIAGMVVFGKQRRLYETI